MQANAYKHKETISFVLFCFTVKRETEDSKERPGKGKEQKAVRPDVRTLQGGKKADMKRSSTRTDGGSTSQQHSLQSPSISITGTDREKDQNQLAKALHTPSSEIWSSHPD